MGDGVACEVSSRRNQYERAPTLTGAQAGQVVRAASIADLISSNSKGKYAP